MKTLPLRLVALVFLLGSSLFASLPPAFTPKEIAQGYSDTDIIAKPRADRLASVDAAEVGDRVTLRRHYPRFGGLRVLRLQSGETPDAAIARLRATGRYAYVERNVLRHRLSIPNDPSFSAQWPLRNTGQNSGLSGADIGATTAWDTLTDASSVIVAVIDTGARLTHGDLAANLWSSTSGTHGINSTVSSSSSGYNTPNDDSPTDEGHGTHVAGIIGAVGNNSTGIAGVAWKAKIMPLKFLPATGSGSLADEIECVNYAIANHAQIINASYGGSGFTQAEYDLMKAARDAGIIVVAAAGNALSDNDAAPEYPAGHALDNIVSVAATTRLDVLDPGYSNYGSGSVDLAAPGTAVYSLNNSSDTAYATLSGTSMAAPHVTGVLALLRAKYPTDTYRQSINRLLRSVTKLSALSGKVQSGGRLNLAAALATTDNRPFNDDFSTRATVAGDFVRIRSSNTDATAESGEPAHAGTSASHSLWWSWTAPETTQVAFDTSGSAYDTTLAVYTGSAVNALTPIGSNDDTASGTTSSRLVIDVTAGTTYHIAVDGKAGATGYTALKVGAVPANNNFAAAKTLTGISVRESGATRLATRETGEPLATTNAAGHSVWYRWTAPASGHYSLAAFATDTDTVAAVYTGTSVSALTKIASNDNNSGSSNTDALVAFTASAGTTYYLQVDHTSDGSDGGTFVLTLTDSLWEYPAFDEISGPAAVDSSGTLYFAAGSIENETANDVSIYALNADGTKKWSRTTTSSSAGIINGGPVLTADGTLYVGASDAKLYALRTSNGTVKWSYTTDSTIGSTPALGADGTVYVRNTTKLYALTASGTLKWTFTLNASTASGTYCSPVIGTDGTIYVGTTGGALYALTDATTSATLKWTFTADDDIYTSPAIGADGTLYFATLAGTFYAVTPGTSSATRKWSISLPAYAGAENSITSSPALSNDGTLYFAAYDHKLYALNTSTGATKWTYTLSDGVRACSPAIAADGTVYIGANDGLVYALNSSGTLVRSYPAGQRVRSSPLLAANRLYFGSLDGKLHAFDIGQTNLASPWPMFHQNAQRTGVAASSTITLSAQSTSRTVTTGSAITLSVTATSTATLSYQWYKNGTALSGATSSTYTIASATTDDAGTYTVVVSSSAGAVTSSPIVLGVAASSTLPSTFANISTRAYCSTGNNVTIGGLVINGPASKRVLIRAVGPTLGTLGLPTAEVLADPTIEIHQQVNDVDTIVTSNDDWTTNPNAADITATAQTLGATALASTDTKSAALLTSLPPGAYTIVVKGNNSTSGIVLAEIYDADGANPVSTFANLSTRADAITGNGVAIGGFVISGTVSKTVLIRAVGPTLGTLGVPTAEVLADPTIELHQYVNGVDTIPYSDDDWSGTGNAASITTRGQALGATALASSDTKSAALLVTLSPGAYTVHAKGTNSTAGIVLLEIYDAD